MRTAPLGSLTVDELRIEDEGALRGVALYADLKEILRRARYPFRVLPTLHGSRWDRALFLNLTYWNATAGQDVLADRHLGADVVAHVAWHHLAAKALGAASPDAMFLGESIASAFDLYLVGSLLGWPGRSSFLETQVPAMADATRAAGLSARGFERLLRDVARDPERAFGDLRALLFDATRALHGCATARRAHVAFARLDGHRFGPLLHHYELSNWLLFARAHGRANATADARARDVDRALTRAKRPLEWLGSQWVTPALAR